MIQNFKGKSDPLYNSFLRIKDNFHLQVNFLLSSSTHLKIEMENKIREQRTANRGKGTHHHCQLPIGLLQFNI